MHANNQNAVMGWKKICKIKPTVKMARGKRYKTQTKTRKTHQKQTKKKRKQKSTQKVK